MVQYEFGQVSQHSPAAIGAQQLLTLLVTSLSTLSALSSLSRSVSLSHSCSLCSLTHVHLNDTRARSRSVSLPRSRTHHLQRHVQSALCSRAGRSEQKLFVEFVLLLFNFVNSI